MRPSKNPKYKLDPRKVEAEYEQKKKKDEDWKDDDIYNEILRSKMKYRH